MDNNDNDYSQHNRSTGPTLVQDLALMNWARSGVNRQLNNVEQEKQEVAEKNEKLQANLAQEQRRAKAVVNKANDLEFEVGDLENTIAILRNEVARLNGLLNKPLAEISQEHSGFAKNYEAQMETMAEWMVSQKSFKELAIELGTKNGLSIDDVIKQATVKKLDVLDNKNEESHNTNIQGSTIVTPERVEKLRVKYSNQPPSKEQVLGNIKNIQEQTNQSKSKFII
jgi:uncharacterized small protein (DUF1192 family)